MIPDTIRCMRDRAHQYGADAVILEKEANQLLNGPLPESVDDCSDDQLRAVLLAQEAQQARRRYYRELAALDALMGWTPSPFAELG